MKNKKLSWAVLASIFLSCLLVAILQGTAFFYTEHITKVFLLSLLFLCYGGFCFYLHAKKLLTEDYIVFLIILLGVLVRCSYVLLSGLYDRQHDAGVYTGMGTPYVNPGHIGYIEYLYKFHHLPDLNPYELFAYYHPPLHHIISYLFLRLNIFLGVAEELAFENLQIVPLFCSCLCLPVTYRILKVLEVKGTGLYLGLAFMALHPATILMAGSVNNDMMTILFMCLTMLYSLTFIRNKDLKGLIKLALCIGFGMITKLNSAVLAIPLGIIFLMHFISVLRTRDKKNILAWVKNYLIFAVIVMPIGLSWIVRNLIRFGEKPGVPVPGETSPMYTETFSLWERLGIPSLSDWNFAFPFHPISAKACCNTWVIMFHTSLFGEEYPVDLPDVLLVLCQITFFLAVLFGIATAVLLIAVLLNKKTSREDRVFLLVGYIIMLVSFAAFVIIYPYTCSSDFRYVAICLLYIAIAIGLGNRYYLSVPAVCTKNRICQAAMHVINAGIITILTFINLIYIFWDRW